MANRQWHRIAGALEIETIKLWASATIGATGAVSSFYGLGKGIKSIVRNSAGQYQVNLEDNYNQMLWADAIILDATNSDPTSVGILVRVSADNSASSTTPNVILQMFNVATGAAADPRNGAKLLIQLEMRNSSVS